MLARLDAARGVQERDSDSRGQVELAHATVRVRAYEPPPQPTKMWTRCRKINLVVNLELLTRPVVGHRVTQAEPAIPRIAYAGLKSDGKLIVVKVERHLPAKVSAGFNASPPHHRVNVEP